MSKKNFWQSTYRRIWLPYLLREVTNVPKWISCFPSIKTKHIFVILNRNYRPISHVGTVGWQTSGAEMERPAHELVGSVVSFVRNPKDFKNVWEGYPYLYDSSTGLKNKLVEDYLERLTKLFNHSHEFLTLEQIECLKCKDYDCRHLTCDGWPNCDIVPELCKDYGHASQMIGYKD